MSAFGISPQDRVAAFIDGPNLYGAARSADFDIDFKNLSALMKRDGRLIRAYYYTALADTDEADALAWLRWSHDSHWGDHVQDVTPHLRWLG